MPLAPSSYIPLTKQPVAQELKDKLYRELEQRDLDDFLPGTYQQFPLQKLTNLIEKDYQKMKMAHDLRGRMEEIKTHDGPENRRLQELRKVGIELERRELINK